MQHQMIPRNIAIDCAEFKEGGGEAGGQTGRTLGALVALFPAGTVLEVSNFRTDRRGPKGMRPQHVQGFTLIAAICGCAMTDVFVGSEAFTLTSAGPPVSGEYANAPESATSASACTLIAQTIMAALVFAPGASKVTLVGGLDVGFSPPLVHMQETLRGALGTDLFHVVCTKPVKRGHGGGEIEVHINGLPAGSTFPALALKDIDCKTMDQVMLYMALAEGRSVVTTRAPLTTHSISMKILLRMALGVEFEVKETATDGTFEVACDGVAFRI